jgi:predicted DNA-binding transcriptional regulator YafY
MNYQILETIKQAARAHLVLRIIYTDKDGTSEGWRQVEPYSFSGDDGGQGLFAWDRTKDGIRRFTIERISQAELTADNFMPRYPIEII